MKHIKRFNENILNYAIDYASEFTKVFITAYSAINLFKFFKEMETSKKNQELLDNIMKTIIELMNSSGDSDAFKITEDELCYIIKPVEKQKDFPVLELSKKEPSIYYNKKKIRLLEKEYTDFVKIIEKYLK